MRQITRQTTIHTISVLFIGLALFASLFAALLSAAPKTAAACTAPSTNYGSVTNTVSVPQDGIYRLWTRLKPATSKDTTVLLEVNKGNCYNLGGGTSMDANQWNWVDYQSGGAKVNLTLTAGTHTLKFVGNTPNMMLDRTILTADLTCVPTKGTDGTNCASPVDSTPPTVSISKPAAGSEAKGTIYMAVNVSDNEGVSKVEYSIDGKLYKTSTGQPIFERSIDTTQFSDGSHTLVAKAFDTSGNTAVSKPVTFQVANGDRTPPTVNIKGVTNGATVSGAVPVEAVPSDNEAIAKVDFYVDGDYSRTEVNPPYCMNESKGSCIGWNTTTLKNGQHTIRGTAYDTAGNSASKDVTFTVDNTDREAPVVRLQGVATGDTIQDSLVVQATATDNESVTKTEFYIDNTRVRSDTSSPYCMVDANGNCGAWDSNSIANGSHTLSVIAYDEAGNTATARAYVVVENGDKEAPSAPASVKATATSATKVEVSWQASQDNVGVTEYCVMRVDGKETCMNGQTTTLTDTNVLPNTSYSYVVRASDEAGNISQLSSQASVRTPEAPDTKAPSVPAGVSATAVSTSQINVSWQASQDNVGVAKYDVYRNGNRVATVSSTSYGDTGLKANTSYTYTVTARDTAGNVSSKSAEATTKTLQKSRNGKIAGRMTTSGSHSWFSFVYVNDGGKYQYTRPNSNDRYVLTNLTEGRQQTSYFSFGYETQTHTLTVSPDSVTRKNVRLQR